MSFFNFSLAKLLVLNTIIIAIFAFQIILMGYFSDRIGYLKMMRFGILGLLLFSYPLYRLFGWHDFTIAALAIVLLSILGSFITSCLVTILVTLYPTRVRYSGVAIVYNFGFAFASGLTPMLVTALIHWTNNPFLPAFYLIFFAALALLVTLFMRERHLTALSND
jgi:MFS family permease